MDARKPQFALAKITGGDFDGYFSKFATDVKAFGAPSAIRFAHEMNGGWYPWGRASGCHRIHLVREDQGRRRRH